MTAQIIRLFPPTKLPQHDDVLEGEVVPAVTAPCAPRKRRGSGKRSKMRVEEVVVTCKRVPRPMHNDLRACDGALTIDWKGDVAYTVTFDPDDESIDNIIMPVKTFSRDADNGIRVTSDEGTWLFSPQLDAGAADGSEG